jgi:MYXO-CTERM domain-containing protein
MAIGAGGSLTVHFAEPIRNQAGNPYGLDFLIYGGVSLIDAAWPNGVSDGTVFGNLGGSTRISVSQDGVTFYQLNPSLAPVTEAGLPTDAAGAFGVPANPALQPAAFNGLSLAQIRALYGGSAGGTGYDLAWALDGDGQSVNLTEASYVKVDVLTGQTKLDAIAAVPEPGVWILGLAGLALLAWRRRHQHAQA